MPRVVLYFKRNDGQIFHVIEGSILHEKILRQSVPPEDIVDQAAALYRVLNSHRTYVTIDRSPFTFEACNQNGEPLEPN
jgi:hypothetical protein